MYVFPVDAIGARIYLFKVWFRRLHVCVRGFLVGYTWVKMRRIWKGDDGVNSASSIFEKPCKSRELKILRNR